MHGGPWGASHPERSCRHGTRAAWRSLLKNSGFSIDEHAYYLYNRNPHKHSDKQRLADLEWLRYLDMLFMNAVCVSIPKVWRLY